MAVRIYFMLGEGSGQINALDCSVQTSLAEVYGYVQQQTGGAYEASLSYDGTSVLPPDNTPLQYLFPQGGEVQMFVALTPQLGVSVFIDGQQVSQNNIADSYIIGEFLTQLMQSIQEYSAIQDYQLYDPNGQMLADSVQLHLPFSSYTGGQLQQVILNLTRQQQQQAPQQPEQSSPGKKQLSVNAEQDLLAQLVLLPKISLLIDPNGQFVVYKFHFPVLVQGFLKKSQGKQRNISGADFVPFKLNPNIKYADTDDYGFTIQWDDGSFSSIKVRQQQ